MILFKFTWILCTTMIDEFFLDCMQISNDSKIRRNYHRGWSGGQSQQIMSAELQAALVTKPILLMKVDFELACQPVCLLSKCSKVDTNQEKCL